MNGLISRCSARPSAFRCLAAVMLVFALSTSTYAQTTDHEAPEGIFVDITPVPGWGPFIPRADYEPGHYMGTFVLQGQTWRLFLLRHADRDVEERVLIQPASADVPASEGDGLTVLYRHESVSLNEIAYEIQGVSPVTDQFVLTKKENVQYAHFGLRSGEALPYFQKISLEGQDLSDAKLAGSYTLIHFWGTWCAPCHGEVPFLVGAHDRYGDWIQFLGVAVDDDERAIREYVAESGMTWPQINVPNSYPNTDELVSAFGVRGYPTNYLIGPDGTILIGVDQEMRLRGERLLETLTRVVYDADN